MSCCGADASPKIRTLRQHCSTAQTLRRLSAFGCSSACSAAQHSTALNTVYALLRLQSLHTQAADGKTRLSKSVVLNLCIMEVHLLLLWLRQGGFPESTAVPSHSPEYIFVTGSMVSGIETNFDQAALLLERETNQIMERHAAAMQTENDDRYLSAAGQRLEGHLLH